MKKFITLITAMLCCMTSFGQESGCKFIIQYLNRTCIYEIDLNGLEIDSLTLESFVRSECERVLYERDIETKSTALAVAVLGRDNKHLGIFYNTDFSTISEEDHDEIENILDKYVDVCYHDVDDIVWININKEMLTSLVQGNIYHITHDIMKIEYYKLNGHIYTRLANDSDLEYEVAFFFLLYFLPKIHNIPTRKNIKKIF